MNNPRKVCMNRFDNALTRAVTFSEALLRTIELVAALILVALFAIGVVDLAIRIFTLLIQGELTNPESVIGFIDTALLLFIIVEVFQTVVAYANETERYKILRIVLYTGVIAVVRKIIVFRPDGHEETMTALCSSIEYAVLLIAIAIVLLVLSRADFEE